MKKLLWCAFAIGVIAVLAVLTSLLNPDNNVLAISQSSGNQYEEMIVLKRNRTYEQLFQKKSDSSVVSHNGTWVPSNEDPASQSLASHMGTRLNNNYITFKDKLSAYDKSDKLQKVDSAMQPSSMLSTPDEKTLTLWKQWRAKAKPFNAERNAIKK